MQVMRKGTATIRIPARPHGIHLQAMRPTTADRTQATQAAAQNQQSMVSITLTINSHNYEYQRQLRKQRIAECADKELAYARQETHEP